jgi:hypothetical protein
MDQSLNTTHITGNLSQYEAARSNFFVFQVAPDQLTNLVHPDFDTSAGEPADSDKYNGQIVSDYLRLNVVKASVPNFKISNVITYRRGNDVVKMAGVPEFEDGSITVDDVVGLAAGDIHGGIGCGNAGRFTGTAGGQGLGERQNGEHADGQRQGNLF